MTEHEAQAYLLQLAADPPIGLHALSGESQPAKIDQSGNHADTAPHLIRAANSPAGRASTAGVRDNGR
jgi:hypothetical protein